MKAKAGSLHDRIEAWRAFPGTDGLPQRDPSPEWLQLSPATRKSNEHMIDPKHGYLRRAVKLDLGTLMLSAIDTPNVVKIRNKVGKAFGFWTGNYSVMVLSTMFSWGILYGHLTVNTAKGVSDLERPQNLEAQHRSWANAEFAAMVDGAREREWRGIVLRSASARSASILAQSPWW